MTHFLEQSRCLCSELNGILQHNQFVFGFAATRLLGFLFFSFAVAYSIFCYNLWKDDLTISFNIIVFSSFLFDHTLETQIGLSFFLFFQVLLLHHRNL
jgi:O-antigen ligase